MNIKINHIVFFFKTYRVSKFTNANKSFWKLALFLFWAIEGFLFSIVIFIWFITPTNLKIGVGHNLIEQSQYSLKPNILETIWIPTLLIVLTRAFLIYKKSSKMVNILFVITILSIVSFLFFQELYQLITIYTRTRTQFGTYALSTDTETSAEIPTLFDNMTGKPWEAASHTASPQLWSTLIKNMYTVVRSRTIPLSQKIDNPEVV